MYSSQSLNVNPSFDTYYLCTCSIERKQSNRICYFHIVWSSVQLTLKFTFVTVILNKMVPLVICSKITDFLIPVLK